jgi:hypothetical protein
MLVQMGIRGEILDPHQRIEAKTSDLTLTGGVRK